MGKGRVVIKSNTLLPDKTKTHLNTLTKNPDAKDKGSKTQSVGCKREGCRARNAKTEVVRRVWIVSHFRAPSTAY